MAARPITSRFSIAGRGTVVGVEGVTREPVSRALARVVRPDGSALEVIADRMMVERRDPSAPNDDAFMLMHVAIVDVPDGSSFEIIKSAEIVGAKSP